MSAQLTLTDEQLRILRHMLGIDDPYKRNPVPYRDYYCAPVGDKKMIELAATGAVEMYSGPSECMPYDMYRTTPVGRAAAIESQRAMRKAKTRGQRRYWRYLDAKDAFDIDFRTWLTHPRFKEARESA